MHKHISDHLRLAHSVPLAKFPTGLDLHTALSRQKKCNECKKYYRMYEEAPKTYTALHELVIDSEVLDNEKQLHERALHSVEALDHDDLYCVMCNALDVIKWVDEQRL